MDLINPEELTDLLEAELGVHVSLFMPLAWEPNNRQANHIHLENLVEQGKKQLQAEGFLPPEIPAPDLEALFQPVLDLMSDGRFDEAEGRGLAAFLAPGMHRIYRLPTTLDERLVIGPRFHIRPLLPLLVENGRFYLLSLSQNKAQLWRGGPFNLEPLEVPGLPVSLDDALAEEDPERYLQSHTSGGHGRERPALFHGQEFEREKKGAILRYCREVNDAVQEFLSGGETPLLLAAVAYLLPIYQEANTYPHLLPDVVPGNPDELSAHQLHKQTLEVFHPYLERSRNEAIQQYRELAGTERTSRSLAEIVPAAAYGRVHTLIVPTEVQRRGRFNPDSGEVETCPALAFGCEDLLNLAAATTLLHDGAIYSVPLEEMPGEARLAAIFRYAA